MLRPRESENRPGGFFRILLRKPSAFFFSL
jgi:hypothetical protein